MTTPTHSHKVWTDKGGHVNSTGALAAPFDPLSLAAAIRWVLEDPQRRRQLSAAARQRAERLWEPARVAGLVADVYRQAAARTHQRQ